MTAFHFSVAVFVALMFSSCLFTSAPPPPPPGFRPLPPYQHRPLPPVDPYATSSPYGEAPSTYEREDEPTAPSPAENRDRPVAPRPGEYPTAKRTANPNEVISPYEPYNIIDVAGFTSGQLARDPSNKKIFRVP